MIKRNRNNTGNGTGGRIRYAVSWLAWPALFIICMSVTAYGFAQPNGYLPYLCFNGAYAFLILSLWWLERVMPHEPRWQAPDGQTWASILHTLTSKGTSQVLLVVNTYIGAHMISNGNAGLMGIQIWPSDWPVWAQVVLAVVAAEFMLYWAHRLGHEWMPLWRFHSVHHSVEKLWFVNTGRFHFVDSLVSIVLGVVPLIFLGASMEVIMWLGAVTAFIGMLTHCNVEMRFGPISYMFNTPELHRWHHSKKLREVNMNYGENVMVWDLLFRTFFNENRRPPVTIGITDYMPLTFREQIIWPFLRQSRRDEIAKEAGFVKKYHLPPKGKKKENDKPADYPQAAE